MLTFLCGFTFLYWSYSFSRRDDSPGFRSTNPPKQKTPREGFEEALVKTNEEIKNLLKHKAYLEECLTKEINRETS
jgi:hypothetical protein